MVRVIPVKLIKGTVFIDSNNDSKKDDTEQVLKDVAINLYYADQVDPKAINGSSEGIRLYREKLIMKTKTDEKGEYKFYVNEGRYSVNLDIDALPSGKGVANPNVLVDTGDTGNIDFAVRDIHSIELDKFIKNLIPGDSVTINPVVKDRDGNPLSAKVNCICDSNEIELNANSFKVRPVFPERKKVNIKVQAGPVSNEISLTFKSLDTMSLEEIRLAYEKGAIDEKTKISKYLKLLFRKPLQGKRPDYITPIKSGSTAIKEIQDYIMKKNADKNLIEEARQYMSSAIPYLDKVYTSPSGFFKIHYTTAGTHAVSKSGLDSQEIPEYIKSIGLSFDHVKKIVCDTRGFRTPIIEKGKNTIDVYVYDLQGKYGITIPTAYYEMTADKQRRASCSISIDNNYSSSKGFKDHKDNCMRVTAAHEFFHAVQNAYNADADSWWKEASATWNEDEIYNNVNDYVRYLDKVFSSPEKSLEQTSYGGVVFAKYLSEHLGGYNLIKRILEIQGTTFDTSVKAIDAAVKEKFPDKDIGVVFKEYAACNFNPSQYYKEGALWKKSVSIQNTFSAYPVALQTGILNHLAANYQLFKPKEVGKALKVVVDGARNTKWGFKIQRRKSSDNLCSATEIALDGFDNRAEIILQDFGSEYKEICLIPANLEKAVDGLQYKYSAAIQQHS